MSGSREELKKTVIAMLLMLQSSDNTTDLREFAYIHKVAVHLGMSAGEVQEIEKQLDKFPLKPPADEKERMTILYYLLFLMEVDGDISPEEVHLVKEFGLRLGFRIELLDELIEIVKQHSYRSLPTNALLNPIKKYLN